MEKEMVIDKKNKHITLYKLTFFFIVACIIGTYYEQIVNFVQLSFLWDKPLFSEPIILKWDILFVTQHGVLYGPFNPIYGLGGVLIALLFCRKKRPWYITIPLGSLVGGIFEYALNFFEELFTGSVSWDYSDFFLNINGRTTLPFMLIWGVVFFLVTNFLYPIVIKIIEKIPVKIGKIVIYSIGVFLALDMMLTGIVLLREAERSKGNAPITMVGEFIDKVYTDEFLKNTLPDKFDPWWYIRISDEYVSGKRK